ncbi:hypothetical protein [Negadavirga shengliensis]|uniref:Lipid A 3-O-deacylase PagL n=1 Tax=Negadavirga shengliensis TaxID=1389218 RepID=A0ABV9T434_9BACT
MKFTITIFTALFVFFDAFPQIPVDLMGGHKATEFSFFWFEDVDAKKKVELFNFTFFSVDYQDQSQNEYEIYQAVTYKLNRNWGFSGVGRFAFNEFMPQIAVAYQLFNGNFFFAAYPYLQYSGVQDIWSQGAFGFVFWNPKLNEKWKWFHMLLFETNVDKRGHQYSFQQLRLGVESPQGIQFGLGATLGQKGAIWDFTNNLGLFIRKEL